MTVLKRHLSLVGFHANTPPLLQTGLPGVGQRGGPGPQAFKAWKKALKARDLIPTALFCSRSWDGDDLSQEAFLRRSTAKPCQLLCPPASDREFQAKTGSSTCLSSRSGFVAELVESPLPKISTPRDLVISPSHVPDSRQCRLCMASTAGVLSWEPPLWAADRSGDKALPTFQEKLVCLGCVEISKRSGRALRITPPDTGVRVRSPGDRESRGG